MVRGTIFTVAISVSFFWSSQQTPDRKPHFPELARIEGMSEWDHRNTERNLRWILERERQSKSTVLERAAPTNTVGIFVDVGVWHIGARSLVECLEAQKIHCVVLDRTQIDKVHLSKLKALILPGGWAPFQWQTLGQAKLNEIRAFAQAGGRVVGVCAGAYLVSSTTRVDGKEYPYPIGLFDGIAAGPVPGLAKFPHAGPVRVTATDIGIAWNLKSVQGQNFLYGGGPYFVGGTECKILLTYVDGTSAAVYRKVGKGSVIAIGVHMERPSDGQEQSPPHRAAGPLLESLLFFDPTRQE